MAARALGGAFQSNTLNRASRIRIGTILERFRLCGAVSAPARLVASRAMLLEWRPT